MSSENSGQTDIPVYRNYYSSVPVDLIHDKRLSPGAKLLYCEVVGLTNSKGYCWAKNDYFMNIFDISDRTVTNWINDLIDKNYLKRELVYYPGCKIVKSRRLYLGCCEISPHGATDCGDSGATDCGDSGATDCGENNININNNNINNKHTPVVKNKHTYGENKNVLLTDEEYEKLKAKFPDYESKINDLSYYLASKGAKYKSHYATILNWARKDEKKSDTSKLKGAGLKYVGVDMGF